MKMRKQPLDGVSRHPAPVFADFQPPLQTPHVPRGGVAGLSGLNKPATCWAGGGRRGVNITLKPTPETSITRSWLLRRTGSTTHHHHHAPRHFKPTPGSILEYKQSNSACVKLGQKPKANIFLFFRLFSEERWNRIYIIKLYTHI